MLNILIEGPNLEHYYAKVQFHGEKAGHGCLAPDVMEKDMILIQKT